MKKSCFIYPLAVCRSYDRPQAQKFALIDTEYILKNIPV